MSLRSFIPVLLISFSAAFGPNAHGQTASSLPESPPTAPAEPIKNEASIPAATKDSWPDFQKAFEAGVLAYQAHKYDEARLAFSAAAEKEPTNVEALTNLALVQFQLGQKGLAVGLLRKAQNLDPNFSTPKSALQFILPQMDVKEIPHEIQMWETFRSHFIVPFSLNSFLSVAAIAFFSSGWMLLSYFGRRREALRAEKSLPGFPMLASLACLIFVVMFTLSILKVIDGEMPRGTVIKDKVTVYSAPNDKSVPLFELFSGLEVVLNTADEQWVQVTYPGALTGWIPKANVLQTSGRNLW
jgi:hypothetical protein